MTLHRHLSSIFQMLLKLYNNYLTWAYGFLGHGFMYYLDKAENQLTVIVKLLRYHKNVHIYDSFKPLRVKK